MRDIKQLNELFNKATNEYNSLKSSIESQVVRWFWASNDIFSLEPFWFEQNRFSKGKILKEEPTKNRQYAIQYGVNASEEIIVGRQMTSFNEKFYETFYFREKTQITSYRFDYSDEKELENIKQYSYKEGKIDSIYAVFGENGYAIEQFIYENNQLVRKEWKGIDEDNNSFERIICYAYDEIGQLKTIKEGDYIWYEKPDKKLNLTKLAALSQEKLLSLLKETIRQHAPKEPLYCLNISYMAENIFPPQLGFGTQADREQWKDDLNYKYLLWNIADYSYSAEIDLDEPTAKLFELFSQEMALNEKQQTGIKAIITCAKDLKDNLYELDIQTTDDFVIVAGYFDQSDFKKNFKQINPEKMDAFKAILV